MIDFYKWLTNNDPRQKVDVIITTLKNNGGYFGLRYDGDEGWSITDGLLPPDELRDHFTEIDYPKGIPLNVEQKLVKAIFKGSIKHI